MRVSAWLYSLYKSLVRYEKRPKNIGYTCYRDHGDTIAVKDMLSKEEGYICDVETQGINDMVAFQWKKDGSPIHRIRIHHKKFGRGHEKKTRKMVEDVGLLLQMMYTNGGSTNRDEIEIDIVLSGSKKRARSPGVVGPCQVNSGVTYTYPDGMSHIVVYREEEYKKVLIHELLHTMMPIETEESCNMHEAYTESVAITLNTVCSIVRDNPGLTEGRFCEVMKDRLIRDRKHIEGIVKKGFIHSLFDTNSMYCKSKKTNTYAYYLGKLYMLQGIEGGVNRMVLWDCFRKTSGASGLLNKKESVYSIVREPIQTPTDMYRIKQEIDGKVSKDVMKHGASNRRTFPKNGIDMRMTTVRW